MADKQKSDQTDFTHTLRPAQAHEQPTYACEEGGYFVRLQTNQGLQTYEHNVWVFIKSSTPANT